MLLSFPLFDTMCIALIQEANRQEGKGKLNDQIAIGNCNIDCNEQM